VFSDERIQKLSERFVCVKIDPRESRDAMQYKKTRYVPEVVFLTSTGRVLTRLKDRTVPGVLTLMRKVLAKCGK